MLKTIFRSNYVAHVRGNCQVMVDDHPQEHKVFARKQKMTHHKSGGKWMFGIRGLKAYELYEEVQMEYL